MNEALREWVRTVLKLPRGNPMLPAADPAEVRLVEPAPRYLSYALFWFWIGLGILGMILLPLGVGGIVALVYGAARAGALPGVLAGVGGALALALFVGGAWFQYFVTTLEVEMLRYTFSERAMRLRRGVMELQEVTISYANIQNVRLVQGPLQRAYGLADLIVETAGGGSGMPQEGIEPVGHRGLIKGVADADKLRDWLLERMRHCRGAGLGDAHEPGEGGAGAAGAGAGAGAGLALPAAALAELEAIRDELRRANRGVGGASR